MPMSSSSPHTTERPRPTPLRRLPARVRESRELWRLFRGEREDPEPFYRRVAADATDKLLDHRVAVTGAAILDLGCGPGWYADALGAKGATVFAVDADLTSLERPDGGRPHAVVGDATRLPVPDEVFDGVLCSNLLEHTQDTQAVFDEIARVLRPGGWAYVSWTNWYSPWGGHDMTPYHLLGPTRGPRIYERRHGPPRKNRYGEGLFAVHIGPTLRLVRHDPRFTLDRVEPRYWPWARAVTRVPGLREVLTWNCVLWLRRSNA